MKLRLISDFHDTYYDHAFDVGEDTVPFLRYAHTDLPHRETLFRTLKTLGYKTPRFSLIRKLTGSDALAYVVYHDTRAHQGRGKGLCEKQRAAQLYRDLYGAEYKGDYPPVGPPVSYRELFIGDRRFLQVYTSDDLFRANCGSSVTVATLEELDPNPAPHLRAMLPLYAVDSVRYQDQSWAVDFNSAPGLTGTGIDAYLTPTQIVEELKTWLTKH